MNMYESNYLVISGIKLFRPSVLCEKRMRSKLEKHLRERYAQGRYEDKNDISAILRYQFDFIDEMLNNLAPQVSSIDNLAFLLSQYDEASKIEMDLSRSGKLSDKEKIVWTKLGPIFRRAIKYMAEIMIQNLPEKRRIYNTNDLPKVEEFWVCAENLAQLYQLCDQSYYLFPEDTVLEILPPNYPLYLTTSIGTSQLKVLDIQKRMRGEDIPIFEVEDYTEDEDLGLAFKNSIGVSLGDALKIIQLLMNEAAHIRQTQLPNPDPILLRRNHEVSKISKKFGYSSNAVLRVLEGFSLSKEKIESMEPNRRISLPKQEYRALRRGFFEIHYDGGKHFLFSIRMAAEALADLKAGFVFKHLPLEWRNESTEQALDIISNKASKWFENLVMQQLEKLDILGNISLKTVIGFGKEQILIPQHIGEIDFLGYSQADDLLIIAECKMVSPAVEMRQFRDDMTDFVQSKKAYTKKFQKKIDWIKANKSAVWQALKSVSKSYSTYSEPRCVAPVMITLYPTFASYFIDALPCVSLGELILEYEKSKKWPYIIEVV